MKKKLLLSSLMVLLSATVAYASDGSAISGADTAWIMASAAMVLLMTPGLALFYSGMVRSKNVLGTLMHSMSAIGVITIQWILLGYSLSFGPDMGGFVGSLAWFGLSGVGMEPSADYATTIPHLTFMIYQCMFAIITPALISGAVAERIKFSSYILFILLWSTLVYDPVCHWIWAKGGWLARMGVMDFAGGLVVHLSSGISALVAAIVIGKRVTSGNQLFPPHNLPMTVMGAGILWFGWFGFNAGSALSSGGLSTMAFVTTHTAAATGMVVWMLIEWLKNGKPTMFGAATGCVAGLATVTPAAGFVNPMGAMAIGAAAGVFCFMGLNLKGRLGYDDSLDAFGVHGVGGIVGTLGAGVFASSAVNGVDGLINGNASALMTQVVGIMAVASYSILVTFIILKVIDLVLGLRISEEQEVMGLDLSEHAEEGYMIR